MRSTLVALALLLATPAGAAGTLPFVSDDYPQALASARARRLPLVVDVWAPWCPACRFMRTTVLTDPRLAHLGSQFVWLEVDTEEPANFDFVEKFPIEAWPTFYVIDPATEQVVLRWMGTATAEELEKLLGRAQRIMRREKSDRAGAAMARGTALAAARRYAEAADAFGDALDLAGPKWEGRAAAADALLQALSMGDDHALCADMARGVLRTLPPGPATARVAAAGLACASALEPAEARVDALTLLEPVARAALTYPGVLTADRSGLFEALLGARQASRDEAGARRVAGQWLDWIEAQSARAATPMARSALDGDRLTAALALGDVPRVIPALEASARALTDEYFARSYLARAYLEVGRAEEAVAAAQAAAVLVEGPRKVNVLLLEARGLRASGDVPAARAAVEEAIRHGEALPETVRPRRALEGARKLREELAAAAPR
jgi:thiol-disulfide isomerase/thioredoxin